MKKLNKQQDIIGLLFYGIVFTSFGVGVMLSDLTRLDFQDGFYFMILGLVLMIVFDLFLKEKQCKNYHKHQ